MLEERAERLGLHRLRVDCQEVIAEDALLSTAVENLPPPVIHLHIQPSSGQRMHRNNEASPPPGVDARHAAALQNRDGLGRRLGVVGGGGPRLYGVLHFRNGTRWQRSTEPKEALCRNLVTSW